MTEITGAKRVMTAPSARYFVPFFQSMSHVMHAERILKEAYVPHKIVPIPRSIIPIVVKGDFGT